MIDKQFRLVVWNILAGGGKRANLVSQAPDHWSPDAVILSEFRSTPPSGQIAEDLKTMGLEHQISTIGEVSHGTNALLIATRSPSVRIGLRRKPVEPGRWCIIRLEKPQLALAGMHIPNQHTGRKPGYHQAVLELARRWRGGPAIFAGDTNSGRIGEDEETKVFNQSSSDWFDGIAAAGWRDAFRLKRGRKREYTWHSPGHDNGFRLDQAFLSAHLKSQLLDVKHVWAVDPDQPDRRAAVSDHAAVIVDLNLDNM